MLDPRALTKLAAVAAEEVNGQRVIILDMEGISSVTDYFLICSGRSAVHVQAIAEKVEERLAEEGCHYLRREGFREAQWVLLDYGFLVVHIFQEPEREFYALEKLWGDAKVVPF